MNIEHTLLITTSKYNLLYNFTYIWALTSSQPLKTNFMKRYSNKWNYLIRIWLNYEKTLKHQNRLQDLLQTFALYRETAATGGFPFKTKV